MLYLQYKVVDGATKLPMDDENVNVAGGPLSYVSNRKNVYLGDIILENGEYRCFANMHGQ